MPSTGALLRTPFEVHGDIDRLPLSVLGKVAGYPSPVGGTLSAKIAVSGTAADPKGNVGVDVAGATTGRFPPTDARLELDFERRAIETRARVVRKGRPLLAVVARLGDRPRGPAAPGSARRRADPGAGRARTAGAGAPGPAPGKRSRTPARPQGPAARRPDRRRHAGRPPGRGPRPRRRHPPRQVADRGGPRGADLRRSQGGGRRSAALRERRHDARYGHDERRPRLSSGDPGLGSAKAAFRRPPGSASTSTCKGCRARRRSCARWPGCWTRSPPSEGRSPIRGWRAGSSGARASSP